MVSEERRCTAKSKSTGEQCKNAARIGYSVCAYHGAGKRARPGGRPIVHGRYSKKLPTGLAETYREAMQDPEMLALKSEIALVDALIAQVIQSLPDNNAPRTWERIRQTWAKVRRAAKDGDMTKMVDAMNEHGAAIRAGSDESRARQELADHLDNRRRLVESERKRMVEMQQVITAERAMILFNAIADAVLKHVSDGPTRSAIADELRLLIGAAGDRAD